MKLITKESAFKIFYYVIASDGIIAEEETEKLNEIGIQLFGDDYTIVQKDLLKECEKKTVDVFDDPYGSIVLLSEYIEEALKDTTEKLHKGIPSRLLLWNLMLAAHSDNDYNMNEKTLIELIRGCLDLSPSVLFEMEQYIKTEQAIEDEIDKLNNSMEPMKIIRPIMVELENRRNTIKQAALALIADEELNTVEKLTIKDDFIDKTQAAIKVKTDPMMKIVNEQAGKVLGEVKKAAAPAASEAGKKLGKAFVGFGSKLMGKKSSDNNEE